MAEKTYRIDQTNPCFDQMALFIIIYLGQSAAMNLVFASERIIRLEGDFFNERGKTFQLRTGSFSLNGGRKPGLTTISNAAEWYMYLGAFKPSRPERIEFNSDFDIITNNVQIQPPSEPLRTIDNAGFMVHQPVCQAIGMAYEVNKGLIESKHGTVPSKWPVELQFFRHARNASFHGNKFNIWPYKGKSQIDPSNPPSWKNYIIPNDSINGRTFAIDFFSYTMVLPFLAEMGEMIL